METDKIVTICDEKLHYSSGYFVTNKWIDNDTFVAVRSEDEEIGDKNELVKISLKDMSIEVLEKNIRSPLYPTAYENKVYYCGSKGIMELNLNDNTKRCVCESQAIALQLTADGKYASAFITHEDTETPSEFYRINIATGEIEKICEKTFEKPLYLANHLMISPTDKDMFFFAHEGNTRYVSNRLWLYNSKTEKSWNIAKQKLNQNGDLGDCFGHEMWAADGKGIYFVKYCCSPEKPTGICYADIQTGNYELLYSKFKYWHVGVSQDGKFLTADTQYNWELGLSEVVVIDTETGEEFVVDMPHMTGVHPCHPHPQLSPDNKKIIYTALDKKSGQTCIKVGYLK